MARSINTSYDHSVASPLSSARGTLRFARSDWGLWRTAWRLGRSKRKVLRRGVPFKMTVIFDLERPLAFTHAWSTNIAPSETEITAVTEKFETLFAKRGIDVVSVQLAQSDVEDTYLGVYGKYIAQVVVS